MKELWQCVYGGVEFTICWNEDETVVVYDSNINNQYFQHQGNYEIINSNYRIRFFTNDSNIIDGYVYERFPSKYIKTIQVIKKFDSNHKKFFESNKIMNAFEYEKKIK